MYLKVTISNWRPVVAQGHKRVTVDGQVVDSIPTRENEMFNIFISSLWCRGNAGCGAPPLNTQCLQNIVGNGERSILILGSFCPHYYRSIS